MARPGEYSYPEIITQAASWRSAYQEALSRADALRALWKRCQGQRLLFTGCGSTHYLALFVAPWVQRLTGRLCRGVPASELLLQTDTLLAEGERVLVVALSRSGETSETIRAVAKLRDRGCEALTISCYEDTELARLSSLTLPVPAGQERSFAQTRSFAGMLVAAQCAAALWAGRDDLLSELARLSDLAASLIAQADVLAARLGPDETLRRITYLGSGPLYGLANEATVKMKEMSLSSAEAYHFLEFRHGPMSLVDRDHLIVGLLSEELRDFELAVLRDLKARGGRILAIAPTDDGLAGLADDALVLGQAVSEAARPVLYLPLLQLLAYHRALGRKLNPDRPRNVVMAIRLDGAEMV
jgi:glucosamine--fructose-6-phosphate aminotransferase (isomerizing)